MTKHIYLYHIFSASLQVPASTAVSMGVSAHYVPVCMSAGHPHIPHLCNPTGTVPTTGGNLTGHGSASTSGGAAAHPSTSSNLTHPTWSSFPLGAACRVPPIPGSANIATGPNAGAPCTALHHFPLPLGGAVGSNLNPVAAAAAAHMAAIGAATNPATAAAILSPAATQHLLTRHAAAAAAAAHAHAQLQQTQQNQQHAAVHQSRGAPSNQSSRGSNAHQHQRHSSQQQQQHLAANMVGARGEREQNCFK